MALSSDKEATLFQNEASLRQRLAAAEAPQQPHLKRELAVVVCDVATQKKLTDHCEEALQLYREGLALDPTYAQGHYNLGVLMAQLNDVEAAVRCYENAIRCAPSYADAHCNLGFIRKEQGDLLGARRHYELALTHNPDFDLVAANLATVLSDLGTLAKLEGDVARCKRLYKESVRCNPSNPYGYYNLGVLYGEQKRFDKAVYNYRMCLHFCPTAVPALHNLGLAFKSTGHAERALRCFGECVKLEPSFAEAENEIGMIYSLVGQSQNAIEHFERAVALQPSFVNAVNNMGVVLRDEGRVDEAMQWYDRCIELTRGTPYEATAHHNKLLAANYDARLSCDQIQRLHLDWGRLCCELAKGAAFHAWDNDRDPAKRITVGYVSSDLYRHSVSYFVHGVLLHHSHEHFRIVCFANVQHVDDKTARLRRLPDEWVDVLDKSADEVCDAVRRMRVDILVDLTGHTAGNRLDVFARKPAPVQFSWIGYPNTTGLPTVDYRFSDSVADPADAAAAAAAYSETILRIDPCFLCYNPDTAAFYAAHPEDAEDRDDDAAVSSSPSAPFWCPEPAEVGPPPCLTCGHVTAGTFNSVSKINARVAAAWARILERVPEMRILLKSKPLACARVQDNVRRLFAAQGIDPARVLLAGLVIHHNAHLAAYNNLDIALDCWPYAGTATSCEAIYMGVPLVTLRGTHHCQNVGASLNSVVGCPELVAETEDQYVDIVVALARDKDRMAKYRGELRTKMLASPLCDGRTYTAKVEDHFRRAWRTFCEKTADPPSNP